MRSSRSSEVLNLRVGDRVRVRPLAEILTTLDASGRLDALPFMPEMRGFCGREFVVFKRIDKISDTVDKTGLRRMTHAVTLGGVRCDGASHGGCQAECHAIWKEAWLEKVGAGAAVGSPSAARPILSLTANADGCTEGELARATGGPSPGGQVRYFCQLTETKAASSYLAWWDPRQFARDLWSGNVRPGEMFRTLLFWIFTLFLKYGRGYRVLVASYNGLQKRIGGQPYPYLSGRLKRTPSIELSLKPGELVRVKSHREILDTLDQHNKNRGMWFDVEMVKYCDRTFKVHSRVDKVIDPKSGRMLNFSRASIILEGVTTIGDYHRFNPRNEYPLWREIWLKRVAPVSPERQLQPAERVPAMAGGPVEEDLAETKEIQPLI